MSRYIMADALKERLIQNIALTNAIDRSFSEAPSIDIVFCKECKHWHREMNDDQTVEFINFSKCAKGHNGNGNGFYCADGERREP